MSQNEVQNHQLGPLLALSDALIGKIDPEEIRHKLPSTFPMERLEEYCNLIPSKVPGFKEEICSKVNGSGIDSSKKFVMLMSLLSSRLAAPVLTGSTTLITEMSNDQKAQLLSKWRDSSLSVLRNLYRSIYALTIATYSTLGGDLHNMAIGYPGRDLREELYEGQLPNSYKYEMIDRVKSDGTELYLPNIDALIIGSGAGAGVVAHTLQTEGYNCLVLEKAKYYDFSEFVFDDAEGLKKLYENSGAFSTKTQELFLLAGSSFGGGTTVNWSASLKTPFKVRKEWYDDFGVDFFAQEDYDTCMDYVFKQMGVSNENLNHSHSNQLIMDSTERLGYQSSLIGQNTGLHKNHDCGFCYLGCKYGIKQGSQACWLRDAAEKGCKFLDQVRVIKIIHKHGKATAALCLDKTTGFRFTIKGPKKFIVSGGTLNTPLVLKDSGFKNKNIGSNLKLHPVTCTIGFHPKEVNMEAFHHPIMTAVSTEVADLDGKHHGPRIESVLHAPFMEASFMPWYDSDQLRTDLLKYNQTSAMLVITRDVGSGKVYSDPRQPEKVLVDYTMNKFDVNALLEGFLVAADMLYMDGVIEIKSSQSWTPQFKSTKPKHERKITDKDYVEWRKAVKKVGFSSFGPAYGSAHQMSSCRMSGKGPKQGAVDQKGRLFECKNIIVADASVFPTASGANPMVTTMSIARHIALDLVADMKNLQKL
ncbi:hypothetical protein PSN45_000023 [Yamadazyma tenuis]|uniref:Long-chain-alcohol oxidase n=1 Tax=Candida tenuis (strain ATCC 10573 / BCRC 21748 / CBS 615 / JCM 9827 / NBRC 10315 / NRRL Y-1498 / VKM Y-70) TaxID=590646 RepID=G3B9Z1_CANTC|nr:uncharacterized protein CANTEDRAFT_108652 [Yamadazyma tenuis ATCC 10573]EGV61357.1 hypothetical protein CANTEDRAFT_108652 [Yamadazyma tenuis ATCC 10573]WEJ92573.1 hypothetical protein PSN45_000023 [Yamadazyma tenuis]